MQATPGERNKEVVRRLVDEVMNAGRLQVLDELYSPPMAGAARRWIAPFREAFPDVQMTVVDMVAEGARAVARFKCSATHRGTWLGRAATGRRFEGVDEVYFFKFHDGRIIHAWGLEDTLSRMRQLGIATGF